MDLKSINWNKETLNDFVSFLNSISKDSYREFTKRITPTKLTIIGVNLPTLKTLAKSIKKGNYKSFLELDNNIFEIEIIKGYIIGSLNSIDEYKEYFNRFIKTIDNWAVCDTFISSSKTINKDKDYFFSKSNKLIKEKSEFLNRVGFVILLNYFISEEYFDKILCLIKDYNTDKYYAEMAISWLLSYMYIFDKDKTINFINNSKLSTNIKKMTIRKIKDSRKVNQEEKKEIKNAICF